jgi:hypothetical protein
VKTASNSILTIACGSEYDGTEDGAADGCEETDGENDGTTEDGATDGFEETDDSGFATTVSRLFISPAIMRCRKAMSSLCRELAAVE